MNFTELENYKHDITGKFKDITSAVSILSSEALKDPESLEILHAVHEVILRMLQTSRTAVINLGVDIQLKISGEKPRVDLPLLATSEAKVRIESLPEGLRYWLYQEENAGDPEILIERLKLLLCTK